jgi:glycosyltransferase involved in cell wall biosynthesis
MQLDSGSTTAERQLARTSLTDAPVSFAGRSPIYCVITPVRNEEKFLAITIEAVAAQSILPAEWIIVDDGSTDRTAAIINEHAAKYPWIRAYHRTDRGFRSTGGGIDGFLDGVAALQTKNWDFLVNLDGDLSFEPDYFERCFRHFQEMPQLGIAGGTVYNKIGEELRVERVAAFHVRGAAKIYRRQCWDSIGSMLRGLGWDTVDEVKANMRGWRTQSFPELQLIHYRATGTAGGVWWGLVKDGRADYIVGYHPLYFAAKCGSRLFRSPILVGTAGLAYGYLHALFTGGPRVQDKEFVSYVRQQQLRRLLGKPTIWR